MIGYKQYGEQKIIKNLNMLLADLKPFVVDPEKFLRGQEFDNFQLKPREVWALFLIGVIFNKYLKPTYYISTDPQGYDGTLVEYNTKLKRFITKFSSEQTLVTEFNSGDLDQTIIQSIGNKHKRGKNYCQGKDLVIFIYKMGELHRKKIRDYICKFEYFRSYWIILLEKQKGLDYSYKVACIFSRIDPEYLYLVKITDNFSSYEVMVEK